MAVLHNIEEKYPLCPKTPLLEFPFQTNSQLGDMQGMHIVGESRAPRCALPGELSGIKVVDA